MSSQLLASLPGDDCFKTVEHTGTPRGKTITIAGLQTYLTEPKSQEGHHIILYFSDVFGPFYLNNQLIMDYFASHGFTVVSPDYFFGDSYLNHESDPNFDRSAWSTAARKTAHEHAPKWIEGVRDIYGTKDVTYCAVGYCFGAPFVVNIGATDMTVAAAVAHPSALEEEQFRKIKAPLLLSCAETDRAFPTEFRRRAEDILVERGVDYHFQVFSGVTHGFAVRSDPSIEVQRWAKEESARGIIEWFKRFSKTAEN